jgi:hypothetical protein
MIRLLNKKREKAETAEEAPENFKKTQAQIFYPLKKSVSIIPVDCQIIKSLPGKRVPSTCKTFSFPFF